MARRSSFRGYDGPIVWEALLGIAGSLLFGCATEPATGELYFKDDAGHVHQLTVTEPRQGAWDAVWQGDRIVAVIDRGFQNGLELRDLSTPPAEVGRRLGGGVSPAVSPTGTLAYTRIGERNGRLVDLVVRRRGNRRRVIGHAPLVQRLHWISRRRLVAVSESHSGRDRLVEITPKPSRSRTLGKRIGALTISRQRRLAYSFGFPGHRRIAITRLDGSHRHSFRSVWEPSPGGRTAAASSSPARPTASRS